MQWFSQVYGFVKNCLDFDMTRLEELPGVLNSWDKFDNLVLRLFHLPAPDERAWERGWFDNLEKQILAIRIFRSFALSYTLNLDRRKWQWVGELAVRFDSAAQALLEPDDANDIMQAKIVITILGVTSTMSSGKA